MESIDLELGELFDRNAIEEDDGDDIGANPDDNNAAPEGDEGFQFRTFFYFYLIRDSVRSC
jgi:hypothetical protein